MRSLLIKAYMCFIKIIVYFTPKDSNDSLVYLMGFPDNDDLLITSLANKSPTTRIMICYNVMIRPEKKEEYLNYNISLRSMKNPLTFFFTIVPAVVRAKSIISDNYFAFLADIPKKNGQNHYQIWHASGAIKKFGWQDPQTLVRSISDKKRFQRVYDSFDYFILGSEQMAQIFSEAYKVEDKKRFILTGVPRSDFFLDTNRIQSARKYIFQIYPAFNNKRIILYAPTYRKSKSRNPLDYTSLMKNLGSHTLLLLKKHPMDATFSIPVHENIIDVSKEEINVLLTISDILITDYSSIPFDYTLLQKEQKKTIFFCYDIIEYQRETGLQEHWEKELPGVIVNSQETLVKAIECTDSHYSDYNTKWNQFNDGQSTKRFVELLLAKHNDVIERE